MLAVPFLFVLASGFAGLVYQVTWQKYLSIFLGSHALATALVLAVFFCSLSAGYLVIGRWAHRFKHQFALYGLIEGVIGVYCLVSPNIFDALNILSHYTATSNPSFNMLQHILFAFAFIGGPTFLMGGTIPVLTQALSSEFEGSHKVHSFVYGLNTLGAFLGTLMAGFFFLEWWGLPNTLILTSFINIGVGAGCYVLYKINPLLYKGFQTPGAASNAKLNSSKVITVASSTSGTADTSIDSSASDAGAPSPTSALHTTALLLLSFLSGFYVFGFETLIIRVSGLSLGSSTYTYTIIVASFIAAIAAGSFVVARLRAQPRMATIAALQACMLAAMLATYFILPWWPEIMMRLRFVFQSSLLNFTPFWFTVLVVQLMLLIVPIGLLGMNLPLLFHFLKNQKTHLSRTVGSIYALNSLGSALGALVGGYFLFYWFSMAEVYKINLIAMLLAMPLVLHLYAQKLKLRWRAALYAIPLVALLGSLALPHWPNKNFSPGLFHYTHAPKKQSFKKWMEKINQHRSSLIFYKDDPNTSVSVSENKNGERNILVNGKPDSATRGDHETRALAPLLALSVAPRVENIFIAGLGAGLSLSIAHQFDEVKKITVAEIAQGVVDALPYFDKWNNQLSQHKNKKYNIIVDDAYKVLKNKKFDVVIIEPSNPWVTGVEKLYSLEFYKQVSQVLGDEGVFAQWFPTFSMEDKTLLTIFNNFNSVFKYVSVWQAGGTSALTIIASHQPVRPSFEQIEQRYNKQLFETYKLNAPSTLLGNQYLPELSTRALTEKHTRLHTLTHPVLAYEAGKNRFLNFSTHIDAVSKKFLTRPVLPEHEDDQFYYERLGLHKNKEFLQASLTYWSARSSSSHTRGRLKYFLAQLEPKHKLIHAPQRRIDTYMYLSGHSDKVPQLLSGESTAVERPSGPARVPARVPAQARGLTKQDDFLQALHQSVSIYFRLLHWRLPAKLARLQSLFPEARQSCLRYKTAEAEDSFKVGSAVQSSAQPEVEQLVDTQSLGLARSSAEQRRQQARFKACNRLVDILLADKQ